MQGAFTCNSNQVSIYYFTIFRQEHKVFTITVKGQDKREFTLKLSRSATLLTPYVIRKPKASFLCYFNKSLFPKLFITNYNVLVNMQISSDN